jgi:hypothetical protein
VRHRGFHGELTAIDDFRADFEFKMVAGLAGPDTISFESVNYPGNYLRHADFRIQLRPNDGSDGFKKDASFYLRDGLSGTGTRSLESVNYPGYYVRHSYFQMYLHQNDQSELFRVDASFRLVQ